MKKFELHITIAADNCTAITQLAQQCDLSTTAIKQAINKGALWLTKKNTTRRFRRIKKILKIGEELHFYYDESILSQTPSPAILIADRIDYSVWYKPYGMLSQGTKWSDHCSISRWAQKDLVPERPVFIVHRLDKAATGIIIIAHTKTAVRALTLMFESRNTAKFELEKLYQIIVHGNHSNHSQPEVITTDIDNKKAMSTFNLLHYDEQNDLSLIAVKIDTGRKHQIRLHAASINLPVVGDRLHGDKAQCYSEELNLQLTAVKLSFTCPLLETKQVFELNDDLKPNIKKVIAQLKQ